METRRSGQQCLLTVGHFYQETVKIHKYCFSLIRGTEAGFEFERDAVGEQEAERTKVGDKERDGREEKWAGAGMRSESRGTALICIRPTLHGRAAGWITQPRVLLYVHKEVKTERCGWVDVMYGYVMCSGYPGTQLIYIEPRLGEKEGGWRWKQRIKKKKHSLRIPLTCVGLFNSRVSSERSVTAILELIMENEVRYAHLYEILLSLHFCPVSA